MSYGIETIEIHKKLSLDKRKGSDFWYARLTLGNGKRVVKSTKTTDLDDAKEKALELYYETQARVKNNLPAITRKFKDAAGHAIKRMQAEMAAGAGKQSYKDYISALNGYLIPYFGATDVDKIDLAGLTAFDAWREQKLGRKPAQSTINNHNAALNRVLDEAELHGWISKAIRPTLLNKGVPTQSRGSFTLAEYTTIYTALREYHKKTAVAKAAATRETLYNYVLFLANTGVRHGTEALKLRWRNIEWYFKDGERYLQLNVDGKRGKRPAIARDRVEKFLLRQSKMNPRLNVTTFDQLVDSKSDEFVFTTRLGQQATIFNLGAHFNSLLDELNLKTGADGKPRTLYSLRHFYATQDLERGMTTHQLSKQMGNTTTMLDKHYSKYSPLLNADLHSGRKARKQKDEAEAVTKVSTPTSAGSPAPTHVSVAFDMLKAGQITLPELYAVLGVSRSGYAATDEIALKALEAKRESLIDGEALLKILNG